MQVAINISHNLYESIIKNYDLSKLGEHELYKAVQNGTPLPECEQEPILDKIREEITELGGTYVIRDNAIYAEKIPKYERLWYVRLGEVIDILDKYRAESEGV